MIEKYCRFIHEFAELKPKVEILSKDAVAAINEVECRVKTFDGIAALFGLLMLAHMFATNEGDAHARRLDEGDLRDHELTYFDHGFDGEHVDGAGDLLRRYEDVVPTEQGQLVSLVNEKCTAEILDVHTRLVFSPHDGGEGMCDAEAPGDEEEDHGGDLGTIDECWISHDGIRSLRSGEDCVSSCSEVVSRQRLNVKTLEKVRKFK
jgi:hypothetical protein